MNNLKILFAASEAAPIAKVGGLADVIGALPKALAKLNLDIRVIIPFYGAIDRSQYLIKLVKQNITVGTETVNLWQTNLPDSAVPVYLVEHRLFKGKEIYGDSRDVKKFIFFSRALLESAKAIDFAPDVIHLNDWHTAIVPELLKTNPFFSRAKTLLTIHNLASQGIIGSKNLLADGILNANLINTVSPTYAREILTKEFGAGLEKILIKRRRQLYGILNGIDTNYYNPQTDKLIAYNYRAATLKNKTLNKLALQKQLGWPAAEKIALVSLVSRLVWQKGLELIIPLLGGAGVGQAQFVFLGTGEKKYEDQLKQLAKKFPKQISAQIKFDETLAHQVYAGSDIFLAPSRFEPCGLTQLIAMRYGAVPLVRATGGLADTVAPLQKGGRGVSTGFTFKDFAALAFHKTLAKALDFYCNHPAGWRQLQANGMKGDFSWHKSARQYLRLYQKLTNPEIFAKM
ncbi:MAG: glycogen synthase [bacterium]|nr:glycogen synthase [bacterium]